MGKSWPGAAVVVSSMLLPGCAGSGESVECPAIGWSNNLLVELEGNVSAVAEVQGCVDGACSQVVQPAPQTDAPVEKITPEASGGTGNKTGQKSHLPSQYFSPYTASRRDGDSWAVNLDMDAPKNVTVRALDADGTVLAEDEYALEWVRVGGSEQCGGPGEAGPVTLTVP